MGQDSKIEWTRHTFNPWIGCTKVSDGCKFCYAEALMDKRWGKVEWGPNGTRVRTSPANWRQPLAWDAAAKAAGERHRVFCASLADVFEGRPELDEWLVDLLLLIDATPHLDWLLLTKRPENVPKLLPTSFQKHPRENVWIGTSVENQKAADERIPHLLRCPAAVRFLSVEPLLGPVDIIRPCGTIGQAIDNGWGELGWVIVGGESGPGARPMHPDWARSIRDQCQMAGWPFFFKQWGEWREAGSDEGFDAVLHPDGHCPSRYDRPHPDGTVTMRRVGKKTAGRLLDGRTWDEFPAVPSPTAVPHG